MSLILLDTQETPNGFKVTFATHNGIEIIEGSGDEMALLGEAMAQVALLAQLNDTDTCWITSVPVGHDVVYLGLLPHHNTRMRIIRS